MNAMKSMRNRNPKPWRCNYCQQPATHWAKYRGYISRNIRPITGGSFTLWMAACNAHVGCANWKSILERHPEAEVS